MAGKIFSKFGLKRSLNLADVPNKKQAINNLLDGLADGAESFTWEDIEVIRDIYLSDLSTGTFTSASDATVKQIIPNGQLRVYNPLITLENRFDKAYFTTSEPFFAGGDGLTASYYDTNAVQRAVSEDPSSTFNGFNPELLIKTDNFWERGNFSYTNKIIIDFASLYGGVQWEGYFKPSTDGTYSIRIRTGGFLKVEFDDKTEPRDFTFDANTGTFNYNNYDFTKLTTLTDQTQLDQIADLSTAVIVGPGTKLGETRTVTLSLGPLVKWEAYKIRITYFIDQEAVPEDTDITKSIDINMIAPGTGEFNLNYKSLFTKNYFQNYDIGDFRDFVENSISFGGTEIGSKGTIGDVQGTFISSDNSPTAGDSYRNVNNINPIISYYKFPNNKSEVETNISGCSVQQNITTISISNNQANSTEGIEIGNYVFGSGIQPGTRVVNVVINSNIEISPAASGTASNTTLTFVDHRGLVGFGEGDVYDNRIENITNDINLLDVESNQIVLASGLSFIYDDDTNNTTGISVTGNLATEYTGTQINLNSVSTTSRGNQRFYVYQTSGLNDNGLKFFCQGVLKARLLATQSDKTSNSVTIEVDDVTGITNNMYVHAFPSVNFGDRSDGTETEFFSKVQVTNISGNTITITGLNGEPALVSTLEYNPEKIKNIVFTSTDVNKEVCFKPTDTSPPFAANSAGLTTPFNVALVDDFTSNGGGNLNNNGKVTYSQLEIKHDVNIAANVIDYGSETISDYLPIEDGDGNTFYILLGD